VGRNSVSTIRANAAPRLAGSFLTLDLQKARAAFEAVPWVRHAVVQRVWPGRLTVRLEEHQPAALWLGTDGNDRLVNTHGEVFEANIGDVEDDSLPRLQGPEGSAAAMLAMLQRLRPVLGGMDDGDLAQLELSDRGSWRATLDKGAVIELGRGSDDAVVARTQRFVQTLPRVEARYQRPLESADLRHSDGFAVRLKGVTTSEPAAPARKQ
jgi:cell division protein FtsQ